MEADLATEENARASSSSSTLDDNSSYTSEKGHAIAKGGVACPFPWRLHDCLAAIENEGLEDIASWKSHGRAFTIHKPNDFVGQIMPR